MCLAANQRKRIGFIYKPPIGGDLMLLDEAKNLLFANHIEFQEQAFENETAFLRSLGELCPGGRPCAVAALTIPSKNGRKDISLHFIEESGRFLLEDLWFGDFSFELFDLDEESEG